MISKNKLARILVEGSIIILIILVSISMVLIIVGKTYKISPLTNAGELLLISMGIGSFTSLATGYAFKISEILEDEVNEGRAYKAGEILLEFVINPVEDHKKEWWEVQLVEIRKNITLVSENYDRDFFELDIPHGDIDQCSFEEVIITGQRELRFTEKEDNTKKLTETYKIMKIVFNPFRDRNSISEIVIRRRIPYTAHAWPKIDRDSGKYLITSSNKLVGNFGYTIRVPTNKLVLRLKVPRDFEIGEVNVMDWHDNILLQPKVNLSRQDKDFKIVRYEITPPDSQKRFYINTRISINIFHDMPEYMSKDDAIVCSNNKFENPAFNPKYIKVMF